MDRAAKEKVVSDLTSKFNESNFFILTHNNGLSVHEITNLRNQLREAGSTFKVVKNSLAKIAVNDTKVKDLSEHFNGPLAIVFSEELTSQPKIISDFTKDNENLSIVGGFMDGEIIDKETISKLASLPSLQNYQKFLKKNGEFLLLHQLPLLLLHLEVKREEMLQKKKTHLLLFLLM